MRLTRCLLPLLLLLVPSATTLAQSRGQAEITAVRLGLPPAKVEGFVYDPSLWLFKALAWTPLNIEVKANEAIEKAVLHIETTDGDDLLTVQRVPLAPFAAGEVRVGGNLGPIPYIKAASSIVDVTVALKDERGRDLAEPNKTTFTGGVAAKYFIGGIGTQLPGFQMAANTSERAQKRSNNRDPLDVMILPSLMDLPDHWLGYHSLDLAVLASGNDKGEFLQDLFDANRPAANRLRREALLEWVRRGGHLVVMLGRNSATAAQLPELMNALPVRVLKDDPTRLVNEVRLRWTLAKQTPESSLVKPTAGKLPLAKLLPRPERAWTVLISGGEGEPPLVVQAPYGMGRVTVTAFDLDQEPFADWKDRGAFWEWLVNVAGPRLPPYQLLTDTSGNPFGGFRGYYNQPELEMLNRLQNDLDFFEGVRVVSFGWVAILIIIYIVIIGPVDYYLLKKVFKRMELTWITFPIVVTTISVIAYLTAYALKGKELKINKTDIVDIDLHTKRTYGHTYFTIFSPQSQNFQLSVEPRAPEWGVGTQNDWEGNTVTTWQGRPTGRGGRLFRRSYEINSVPGVGPENVGRNLKQVPIQVWSTKAFSADWSMRLNDADPPIRSTLQRAKADPTKIVGEITCKLPIAEITEAQLAYAGKLYDFATPEKPLVRGVPRGFSSDSSGRDTAEWLRAIEDMPGSVNDRSRTIYGSNSQPQLMGPMRLWPILMHDLLDKGQNFNAGLRELDQGRRFHKDNVGEAILLIRLPSVEKEAETLMTTESETPTRLWLFNLPNEPGSDGKPTQRIPTAGTLRQETYIRIYIPIALSN